MTSSSLRLGIEAHVVGRRQTGNERVVSGLLRALPAVCDHDLFAYFSSRGAASRWRASQPPRTHIRLARPAMSLARIPFVQPIMCRQDGVEVFIAHVNAPPIAPCPIVLLVHDVAFARYPEHFSRFERAYMNRSIPASIKRAAAIVAVSQFTKDEIVSLYDVPPSKITVALNGVDAAFAGPVDRRPIVDPPYFLAIGNLQPRKNLTVLIEGYRRLVERAPATAERLVLVGQLGFGGAAIIRDLQELRRAGRVVVTGYLPDRELVALLRAASVFAFPSVYEGFGLPVIEAMAAGAPVIASDIPVMREVAGEAALLVRADDPAGWSDALRRSADDASLRRDLSELGRDRAASFTWESSASTVVSVAESAATRRTRWNS